MDPLKNIGYFPDTNVNLNSLLEMQKLKAISVKPADDSDGVVFSQQTNKIDPGAQVKNASADLKQLVELIKKMGNVASQLGLRLEMDIAPKGSMVRVFNEANDEQLATIPFYILVKWSLQHNVADATAEQEMASEPDSQLLA